MTEQVTWYMVLSEFNDHLIYQHRLRYRSGVIAPLHSFVHSFIHSFTHSFHSLPCNRSIASSKVSCPQKAIQRFFCQFPVSSLFLKIIQLLFTSLPSSSRHFYPSLFVSFNKALQKQFLITLFKVMLFTTQLKWVTKILFRTHITLEVIIRTLFFCNYILYCTFKSYQNSLFHEVSFLLFILQ